MTDLVIIGGGPAGMSAAVSAYKNGIKDIIILERNRASEAGTSFIFLIKKPTAITNSIDAVLRYMLAIKTPPL